MLIQLKMKSRFPFDCALDRRASEIHRLKFSKAENLKTGYSYPIKLN